MSAPPGPSDHGYLVLDVRRRAHEVVGVVEAAIDALTAHGWSRSCVIDDILVLKGPRARMRIRQVGRRHVLIGDWRGRDAALSAVIARHADSGALARATTQEGWGRYVMAWRDDEGRLALLRDPTGALDCVWWRYGGAVLAAHEPPPAIDGLLPENLEVDWRTLGEIAEAPELLGDRLALRGLTAVNPGALHLIGETAEARAVWRPSDFARCARGWDESLTGLASVVDRTVAGLAEPHCRLVSEISGGLDSAVVASSLNATGHSGRTRFLNLHGTRPEGDERAYAVAVADRLGVSLAMTPKPVEGLRLGQLAALGESVRPALQGLDVTYDAEVARRMRRDRATGLFTGQGGDAVFFQAPDPAVVADRFRREGLRALSPAFVGAVARWTRRSSWTVLRSALTGRGENGSSGARLHPWLEAAEGLPPAKARQLRQFVNAQLFWGDCLRARAGDLLQPLLSQPVAEHCLAIPADRLIQGARDRGLARQAFAERLPASVIHRRSKGDLSYFYGQVTRASLPMLRDLLLDGAQADQGLIVRPALEAQLTEASLIWNPGYNRLLVSAVLEVWAQAWRRRITEAAEARKRLVAPSGSRGAGADSGPARPGSAHAGPGDWPG